MSFQQSGFGEEIICGIPEKELDKRYALERIRSNNLDSILGWRFPVLDQGFISVIDYLGNDRSITQAARISYGEDAYDDARDRHLIAYMMRQGHSTPFEMCEIKFHVCVPMDCWRQWIRHRTANVNESSTRYKPAKDQNQKPIPVTGDFRAV